VAFFSGATNLIANDLNQVPDVFVHDRVTGITERVSVDSSGFAGDDGSYAPALSKDGSVVAFFSDATNLVAGDANGVADVFVHDRSAGATERVSVDSRSSEANGPSTDLSLSADGLIVAFRSTATNLVAGDTKGHADVFLHDRTTGITERESVDSAGLQANRDCNAPAISADGRIVAFQSRATNLSAADLDGVADVFVSDLQAGTLAPVSSTGWLETVGGTIGGVSADGSLVAFASDASNLVAGDTNGFADAFVYDRSIPEPVATSTNYGAGFPGTLGVPDLTASGAPVFGTAVAITIDSSSGIWAPALLVFGIERASIPTRAGGTLLVDAPLFQIEAIPPSGLTMPWTVPLDPAFCGLQLDLQVLELDAGAQFGISFTPGLEWVVGH
jgi:Tol biopolymer transport system component